MPNASPGQLAQWQAQIDADPQIQAILRDPKGKPRDKQQRIDAIIRRILPSGAGYFVDPVSGQLKPITEADAVRNTLLAGGAMAGGLGLAGAFGGGAAAGAGGGGAMAAEGVAPFSGLPGAIPGAGMSGAALGSAAAAGGSMPGWLETVLKVAPVGAGLVNQFAGGGFGGGGEAGAAGQMSPEMAELLKLSMQRMRDQEPLFQAASKQAFEGLPAYAKGK